jgi:hypothetical protein
MALRNTAEFLTRLQNFYLLKQHVNKEHCRILYKTAKFLLMALQNLYKTAKFTLIVQNFYLWHCKIFTRLQNSHLLKQHGIKEHCRILYKTAKFLLMALQNLYKTAKFSLIVQIFYLWHCKIFTRLQN